MNHVVRPAAETDVAGVMELESAGFPAKEQWSESAWASEIAADNRVVLVAEEDDRLAGVITVQHVGGVADLNRVVVAPDQRGRGLGRRLCEAGLAAAEAEQCDEMLLEVRHDNTPALDLYRSLGFTEIARRSGYYGAGVDAVILRRELEEDE